ncbi:circularly permuted type 2 ATP-grasp protein [uncultured Cocleimonas sp.]|uniref:circularly permuted type 2 ATP-grasp protein n=1 Tax=uncultured Cocleimonas sp. TaxID=1051587 RepID=UPI0026027BE6|nr:circularly permuted type 2 ATP-grasp protein [uncultured Cocleimonas sp.]
MEWNDYNSGVFFDEVMETNSQPRAVAKELYKYLKSLDNKEVMARKQASERCIKEMGVSFTIYSEGSNIDRDWPFDIIPRPIPASEWRMVEKGLKQRIQALNMFINDVYNDQKILKDKLVPRHLIEGSTNYLPACQGITPPHGAWANISGTDLVRDGGGILRVLEDNLRVPSGVSYMIENREVTKRIFPEVFDTQSISPISDYPIRLHEMLASLSPRDKDCPVIVVLTPGIFNSAYYEHSFLAQGMGAELVEGADLFVDKDDCVYMRTINGPERVDVIYRRVDDVFIDPEVFNKGSMLGVPGIMRAWKKGNVAIANAPGSGVADDKAVYAYVPKMIKYYLDEDAILPNVDTYLCYEEDDFAYVHEHLDELVIKPVNESGGYGILLGPKASKEEVEEFRDLITKNPRNYVAQPMLDLSTAPVITDQGISPRHLDLRPFVLQGENCWVTKGGLTRVAMVEGSLVVNSSQGGGSKDTWIVEQEDE